MTEVNEGTTLTQEELGVVELALSDVREEAFSTWRALIGSWGSEEELKRRFSPGTHGNHESFDRASILMNEWVDYVLNHPSTVMNPEAFRLASLAEGFMIATYNKLACDSDGAEATVNIKAEEYEKLKEAQAWVHDLEAAGVDNWEGYDHACRFRRERRVAKGDDDAVRHNTAK